jgi:hypothetical protein
MEYKRRRITAQSRTECEWKKQRAGGIRRSHAFADDPTAQVDRRPYNRNVMRALVIS